MPTSVTSRSGTGSCASLLRDVTRRLTHEVNNAANGVAVNLEVVRTRRGPPDGSHSTGPFAERASEQLERLTELQEMFRSLLQLTIDSLDESKISCRPVPSGDALEITFAGSAIPQGLRAQADGKGPISMRNSPQGVILTVPRASPSSE